MSDVSSEEHNSIPDENYIITYPEDFSEHDLSDVGNNGARIESETNGVEEIEEDCEEVVNGVWSPTPQRRNLRLDLSSIRDQTERTNLPKSNQNLSSFSSATDNEKQDPSPAIWQPFGEPAGSAQYRSIKIESSAKHTQESSVTSPTAKKTEEPPEAKNDDLTPSEAIRSEITTTNSTVVNETTDSTTNSSASSIRSVRTSNFPVSQSPTVTLLQKAREGQIPRGAIYINDRSENKGPLLPKNAVLIDQKVTVEGDKVHTDSYYAVPASIATGESSTQVINAPSKYDGIGPTEYGIPVGLRTGVKDEYASDWYKTMYRSLHKGPADSRGHVQAVHLGGYMSEPEYERRSATLDSRRRVQHSTQTEHRPRKTEKSTVAREISPPKPPESQKSMPEEYVFEVSPGKSKEEPYRNQPRSIADYEPGHSSLADKEFQKFWDDFWESLDDLHEYFRLSPRPPQQSTERKWPNAILCDGYESDSTLIHKSVRPVPQPDPEQQKAWYKEIQKGGEIPFTGLRKLAPERPKESLHQYQETEVNIHYKSPIRNLEKEFIEEEELRQRQEESMRRFYAEERLKKQQQQMAEIEMRRHSDNFVPAQKSPIPLDRYDNPFDLHAFRSSPDHPRTLARVLYPFVGQSTRELSLNKGDVVYINRIVDKNWYEGEHHSFVGIFPISYVTVIPSERANFYPKEVNEGYGRVKFNFRAKSPVELSLFKGERVILIRRVDQNWFEGRLGNKKGIFPASYIEVIQPASSSYEAKTSAISPKPSVSPVSPLPNGSVQQHLRSSLMTRNYLDRSVLGSKTKTVTQSLHVDTYNEPIPYRSLYTYHPQNEDELELCEGDTVYVMEKCDDGWYVGTSLRTGMFGTFPGNYVERI